MSPTAPAPHITPAYYARGRRHLIARDPQLAAIIRRAGPCRMRAYQHSDAFAALVETIVSQQLSIRVADVIFGRVCALCASAAHGPSQNGSTQNGPTQNGRTQSGTTQNGPTQNGPTQNRPTQTGPAQHGPTSGMSPARVLALDHAQLRAAGLSGAKARYVHELASKIADGSLVLGDLDHLPDDEVTRVLSQVKGIGPWSTHMFLIFRLHRPDVWPIGDLGIVKALHRFHRLRKMPKIERLERMGEIWRPYRSLAAWYLWASLRLPDALPDAGPDDGGE